ncbi:MAG TPA: hypothetical protein ENK18_22470 [Deltaproteobacteria bacterium]|nr:hypothetical protein [Deltaproteobacteria bacterium]
MPKGKRGEQAEELDLVPIMNLVTILIPFLLMASSFVSLAAIDSTLPAIGQPPETTTEDDEPPLNLSVAITDEGYTVMGNDDALSGEGEDKGAKIPCRKPGCPTPDSYDTKDLTRLLGEIKDRWSDSDEQNVILVPESQVPYEVLVLTMDATRNDPDTTEDGRPRELFPYVVIAGGIQ